MKFLIIFLFLFPSFVWPQQTSQPLTSVNVYLVNALGENSLTDAQVLQLFGIASAVYREQLHIDLKLRIFRHVRNPYQQVLDDGTRQWVLTEWQGWFQRKHGKKYNLNFVILPPIKDQGIYWLAGYSNKICGYRNTVPVAYSNGEMKNSDGLGRFTHSIVGFLHETMHLLGADHDDSLPYSVMNSGALYYVSGNGIPPYGVLPISDKSKRQIASCLAKRTGSRGNVGLHNNID